jgi:predicted TIM-barrel fold metal-dependent hydrolase
MPHQPLSSLVPSRREFIGGSLVGLGGLAMNGISSPAVSPLSAAEPGDKSGYIDAHVHVWTPDTKKYPLASGFTKDEMKPPSFTPEQLFKHATPAGVTRVTLIQMSFYGYDNSYMLDSMRAHPGVFSGVAVIDPNAKPAETMRSLKKQGVRGFRLVSGKQPTDKWLAGEGMQAMWKCGADEGLNMGLLINPQYLPSVDVMCRKYPDTPVVIDHFARIGVDGKTPKEDVDNLCQLADHKRTYVKVSAYYALGAKKAPYDDLGPMIARLLKVYGPERLMWASDCPFQVDAPHTYQESIDLVRKWLDFLSATDREWLLRKTAERVYFS